MCKTKNMRDKDAFASFGAIDLTGKGSGVYSCGVVKLSANPEKDLLDTATSFLKAADRCLNGCMVDNGVEMLTVPGTVCASLSCELFLKYILLIETGKKVHVHPLVDLFKKCSEKVKSDLIERNASFLTILERNNRSFEKSRYHHERNTFSFCQTELLQTAELLFDYIKERFMENG